MLQLYTRVRALWAARDKGATAVEYALIVAVIAMVVVGGALAFGNQIETLFGNAQTCVTTPNETNC
jgi:pilus assembly protein Flp/PilA